MDKDKEEFQHDWYGILGCEAGVAKELVEKAARKLSVLYHPDKTTDPDAPAKFLLIQKAKEILTDDAKKKLIDEHHAQSRKRKEYEDRRVRSMDQQRKRFRDQLDSKIVKEAQRQAHAPDANEILREEIKKRSKVMESMRARGREGEKEKEREKQREKEREEEEQKESAFLAYRRAIAEENVLKMKQVKFKWRKAAESHSEDTLYFLLKQFGDIEDVAIVKGTCALVTFSSVEGAKKAVEHYAASEDFRVTYLHEEKAKERAKVFTHTYTNSAGLNEQLTQEIERIKQMDELRRAAEQREGLWVEGYEELRDGEGKIIYEKLLEKEREILDMLSSFVALS